MKLPSRRGRFWPTLATIVGVAITLALGNWQLGRGAQKRELKARFEAQAAQPPIHVGAQELAASDMDLRRIEARGVFDPRYTVFVDNRIHQGTPGYHVVMPLKIEGSERYVLVNRGWIARPPLRTELPEVRTPPGPVTITGVVVPAGRVLELSKEVIEGRIWQNVTIERYRKAMPISIQPFVVRQDSQLDDALVRVWPAPDFGIEKHYGYAFQWFALAATLAVFYAITQFRSRAKPPAAP
jgi:surfeit locus 1 family protein